MKKNYYTIHKNKKPKKRLYVSKVDRKAVRIIMQVVSRAIELSQNLIRLSQGMVGLSMAVKSILQYESVGTPTGIKDNEVIQNQNGDFKVVPPFKYTPLIKGNWKNVDSTNTSGSINSESRRINRQDFLDACNKQELKRSSESKEDKELIKIWLNKEKMAIDFMLRSQKQEIKQKIASLWEETEQGFRNDNLIISFLKKYNIWAIQDISLFPIKDLAFIYFPLEDENIRLIKRKCSIHHKCPD